MGNWKGSVIWFTVAAMFFSMVACGKKKKDAVTEVAKTDLSSTVDSLQLGETAPDFEVPATNGKNMRLSDLTGSWIVLYFYPKAFTSG